MLNKLIALVRRYEMLENGDTLVCAVSGGADSVAMLYAFWLLREKFGIRLEAAHFNHGLRGEESDRDEAFVRRLCDRLDIPVHVGSGKVEAGRKGLEAAARDARYAFLQSLSGKIATAHTADDNAETVLMRMVRGTGLKGLGAIAPVRGNVIRPMLEVTRTQVLAFLQEQNLSYVEDSSNATDDFLRNRLRHKVMPLLCAENPRFAENISSMAMRLRQDEEMLQADMDFTDGLPVSAVTAMAPAGRSRVLRRFLEHCGVREPEAAHVKMAQNLCLSKEPSASADLPGGITVCRCYDRLILQEKVPPVETVTLCCPGITELPSLGLQVECAPAETVCQGTDVFTVTVQGELVLRSRVAGDVLHMPGGSRSIKKLFIDRKIPAHLRSSVPVVADAAGVIGVYGIGVDQKRAATDLPAIQIRFMRKELQKI